MSRRRKRLSLPLKNYSDSYFKHFYPSLDAAITTQPQQGRAKFLTARVGYVFNFKIIKEQSY